jgi:hypothetical protein
MVAVVLLSRGSVIRLAVRALTTRPGDLIQRDALSAHRSTVGPKVQTNSKKPAMSHWGPLVLALLGPGSFLSVVFAARNLTLLQGELLLALWGTLWVASAVLLLLQFRQARRRQGERRAGPPGRRLAAGSAVFLALGFLLLLLAVLVHNTVPPCAGVVSCGGGTSALDWTGGLLTAVQVLTLSFALDAIGIVLMAVALWRLSAGNPPERHDPTPAAAAPETSS